MVFGGRVKRIAGPAAVLLVFVTVAPSAAQQPAGPPPVRPKPESNPFYDELKEPWQLYRAGKIDSAAAGFRAVLEKAAAANDQLAQAWTHDALGTIHYGRAEYPAARTEFEQALHFYQAAHEDAGAGIAYDQIGSVHLYMGDAVLAREYYRKALKIFEALGNLHLLAGTLERLCHADDPDSDALSQRALQLARQLGDKQLQGEILHGIGDGFFARGVFDAAQEHYQQAAALYTEVGEQVGLSRVLTSEGRLQRVHGHPEKSLELYTQALKLQQASNDRQGAIQSINAMAVAWQFLGNLAKAASHYEQALGMAKETGSVRLVNFELANLATVYGNVGRDREAVEILEKLLRENSELDWRYLRYQTLSTSYLNLGRSQEAIDAAATSIELARSAGAIGALADGFIYKAMAEEKAGRTDETLADAEASLRAIEELRAHLVPSDFMKRGFGEQTQRTFALTIRLLTAAHQPGRALEAAEAARARAFLDLLATRGLQNAQSQPPAAFDQGLEAPAAPPPIEADASPAWRQSTSLDGELPSPVSVKPATFADVQATARRLNSTVLSYWVSPDATYIWVVSPGGDVHAATTKVTSAQLQKVIGDLWSGAGDAGAADTVRRSHWRELYRLLIEPVEPWLPDRAGNLLTIEPHGPLLVLPFAALRNAKGQYLIERFTLHYVPAISLLQFTRENKQEVPAAARRYLLVADPSGIPAGADGKPLAALPGARREVSAVARLLPPSQVTLLEGKQATEPRVRELAGQSTVIHFATHGIIRNDRPFDSFVALGASGTGKDQDGRFTAQEIYGLHLQSDLVVLSACRSGLGQVSGDGVIGLTRAFLYAGTPSVIASLWDVADEPTYRLISNFYRSWLQGAGKGASLRSAQLALLRALRAGQIKVGDVTLPEDPVFWSSFVLQGAP